MTEWIKGTHTIAIGYTEKRKDVDGYTFDFLAYRDESTKSSSCGCRTDKFVITHIPTGLSCGSFSSEAGTRAFIEGAVGLDGFRECSTKMPEQLKERLKLLKASVIEKTGAVANGLFTECSQCAAEEEECPHCGCTCGGR